MKIAHVIDYFQPSFGYQETYLAKEAMKQGHSVTVFTSDRYFPFQNYDVSYKGALGDRITGIRRGEECGINVVRLPIEREYFCRVWMIGLEKELQNFRPDYILVHGVTGISAFKVAKMAFSHEVRIVYDDHMGGAIPETVRRKMMRFYYAWFMRKRIIDSATMVACVTRSGIKYFQHVLKFPKSKLRFIPLGYDPDTFYKNESARNRIRDRLDVKGDEILGIYSGKLNRGKGINELIESLKAIFEDSIDFRFIFVGNGDQSLIERIETELPKNRCAYVNFVDPTELAHFFNAADFGIWPNGITASHIEANACGLPIIVSPWQASKERIVQGNGIALTKCTPEEIGISISTILHDRVKLSRMQKAALEVSQVLTWKSINQQFLAL